MEEAEEVGFEFKECCGFTFPPPATEVAEVVDVDFGGDVEERVSLGGFGFFLIFGAE